MKETIIINDWCSSPWKRLCCSCLIVLLLSQDVRPQVELGGSMACCHVDQGDEDVDCMAFCLIVVLNVYSVLMIILCG